MSDNIFNTTPRRTKFIQAFKETQDQKYAASVAWPELPEKRRTKFLKRYVLTEPQIQAKLEQNGLGINKTIKRIASALNAKKTISINGWIEEIDDTDAQLKAAELSLKMHRVLTPQTEGQSSQTVNVNIDPVKLAEVARRLEEINQKMLPAHGTTIDV